MRERQTKPFSSLMLNPEANAFSLLEQARPDLEYTYHITWHFLQSQLDETTGFPADRLERTSQGSWQGLATTPTNIGLALACIVAADKSGLAAGQGEKMAEKIVTTTQQIEKIDGFMANWYDAASGKLLKRWPADKKPLKPFVSSLDNAWGAAGIFLAGKYYPRLQGTTDEILAEMDFRTFFNKQENAFHGGFHLPADVENTWIYPQHYLTEARILYHVALLLDQLSLQEYLAFKDNFPKKTFGGSMFEALMPRMLIREEDDDLPLEEVFFQVIQDQIERGRLDSGFWGFSPCDAPDRGDVKYMELGVNGHYDRQENPDVVAPYAVLLALEHAPHESLEVLQRMVLELNVWDPACGFQDGVNVSSKETSNSWLFLDQAMSFLSLSNILEDEWPRQQLTQEITAKIQSQLPRPQ